MTLPICLRCELEMLPLQNAYVLTLMSTAEPYMQFHSDRYHCPQCLVEIAVRAVQGRSKLGNKLPEESQARYWSSIQDQQEGIKQLDQELLKKVGEGLASTPWRRPLPTFVVRFISEEEYDKIK